LAAEDGEDGEDAALPEASTLVSSLLSMGLRPRRVLAASRLRSEQSFAVPSSASAIAGRAPALVLSRAVAPLPRALFLAVLVLLPRRELAASDLRSEQSFSVASSVRLPVGRAPIFASAFGAVALRLPAALFLVVLVSDEEFGFTTPPACRGVMGSAATSSNLDWDAA